jgi:DNA-binding MarR family transcriptional regulator/GNAT superfamily N-acetyltransferase
MHDAHREEEIRSLRAFNRAYTSRLGLLNAHLDESPFSLSEARILYEIGHEAGSIAADIARVIRMDRAQLSRTLRRFKNKGLVEAKPADGRSQSLSLTESGSEKLRALEHGTERAIGSLLDELSNGDRNRLLGATATIAAVLGTREPAQCALRDLKIGDLGWVIHRQAVLYAEEYGWNLEYEGLVAGILGDFVKTFDSERDAAWIAEAEGRILGSVFLVKDTDPRIGKLRLLYVEPDSRGMGIGKRLIDACIEGARSAGYERLVLWTNSVLTSARRLYERAGFKLEQEEKHHSFGKDLVGQYWSLELASL